MTDRRDTARRIYQAALAAVEGRRCVRGYLAANPLPKGEPVYLLAIGKAAASMALGALDEYGTRIVQGLVITKAGFVDAEMAVFPQIHCLESSHPVPDQRSLVAGERLLRFVHALPVDAKVLCLISGGASALVEAPLPGVSLDELAAINDWLLASGLDIQAINQVRKALSHIKGGGLAGLLARQRVVALYISDVPADDPAVIGSGLLLRKSGKLPDNLPHWLRDKLSSVVPECGGSGAISHNIVANLEQALLAAEAEAQSLGLLVRRLAGMSGEDAVEAGRRIVRELLAGPVGVVITGGEPLITLPERPGRGGRCQSLALSAAIQLTGMVGPVVLAAGSDGNDGPGEAAGALVDGGTIARGLAQGLDARQCLFSADAGRFLAASGDLFSTGPTGSNVTDVVIGLR